LSEPRPSEAVAYTQEALRAVGDPADAVAMAAYLKTEMPFYGVKAPARKVVAKHLSATWPSSDAAEVWEVTDALWQLEHREEKYLAIGYLRRWVHKLDARDLSRVGAMIVQGAWWDLVDETAAHVVGPILRRQPESAWPIIERWNTDECMWLRRTSIICQLGSKDATDAHRLYRMILTCAHEREFFIRKAIGWALREYAKTDPDSVRAFVDANTTVLSPLSRREARKNLR
jgi:3-methyladenine DNA glycosylase AlkD